MQPMNPETTADATFVATNLGRRFTRRLRDSGLRAAFKSFINPQYSTKDAVKGVSFRIYEGSCVGLVGANGAGKTTLLKMAAGLIHPSSGEVKVLGFKPSDRDPHFQRRIGMVMGQKSQLWVDIPASETYELLAAIYGLDKKKARDRVRHLATLFQVEKLLGVPVRRLSLGERMKLEIIAALLHEPRMLFLDEPTIGLDVIARRTIRQFIRDYNRESSTTVILSSHDMSDISEVCNRLLIIASGSLVFDGTLSEFEREPRFLALTKLRDVAFAFEIGKEPSNTDLNRMASKLGLKIVVQGSGRLVVRVDLALLPALLAQVLQCCTPIDVKIEGQNLENLMHQVMSHT